jgi:hypothetical protein
MPSAFSGNDYPMIRQSYVSEISGIMSEYLNTDGVRVTRYRNLFKQAVANNFLPAFEEGFQAGGGDLPIGDEELAWLQSAYDREFGFITDNLFVRLRDEIKGSPDAFDGEIAARAEGYARTLDGVYSQGFAMGSKDVMVSLGGNDGDESCDTCQKLKGKWMRLSSVIMQDLLIHPGNENYICKGFNCQHYWFDRKGKIYTA